MSASIALLCGSRIIYRSREALLKPFDQASFYQQAIETARLGAAGTAIEKAMAAFEDLFLLGKSWTKRHSGCFLYD